MGASSWSAEGLTSLSPQSRVDVRPAVLLSFREFHDPSSKDVTARPRSRVAELPARARPMAAPSRSARRLTTRLGRHPPPHRPPRPRAWVKEAPLGHPAGVTVKI